MESLDDCPDVRIRLVKNLGTLKAGSEYDGAIVFIGTGPVSIQAYFAETEHGPRIILLSDAEVVE